MRPGEGLFYILLCFFKTRTHLAELSSQIRPVKAFSKSTFCIVSLLIVHIFTSYYGMGNWLLDLFLQNWNG